MKSTATALILASTMAFAGGAIAQSKSAPVAGQPDVMATTPDGVNSTPDSTSGIKSGTKHSNKATHSHSTSGSDMHDSSRKSTSAGPNPTNKTPDGKSGAADVTNGNVR